MSICWYGNKGFVVLSEVTFPPIDFVVKSHGFKTGCFTSPHLVDPRERIRLNGKPISEEAFVHYFWRTYERLHERAPGGFDVPPFFRFLTCMSFLVFQEERVDASIVEVGVGGRTCSTNVVQPVVCGITHLGMDHMDVLGPTLTHIAYEKAGIMKRGVPCFTIPQVEEARIELVKQATLRESLLQVVEPLSEATLSLEGNFQKENASLGLVLARYWIAYHSAERRECASMEEQRTRVKHVVDVPQVTVAERNALQQTKWRGRMQRVDMSPEEMTLWLDGAHTEESVRLALSWFLDNTAGSQRKRALICNFKANKVYREIISLLAVQQWDAVVFVPLADRDRMKAPDPQQTWERGLCEIWTSVAAKGGVLPQVAKNIEEGIEHVKQQKQQHGDEGMDVLVTGSLYLTGAVLEYLKWDVDDL